MNLKLSVPWRRGIRRSVSGVFLTRPMVVAEPGPYYTIAELLAASDYSPPLHPEERKWLDAPAVGGELL